MPVSKLSSYRLKRALKGWLIGAALTITVASLILFFVAYREGLLEISAPELIGGEAKHQQSDTPIKLVMISKAAS